MFKVWLPGYPKNLINNPPISIKQSYQIWEHITSGIISATLVYNTIPDLSLYRHIHQLSTTITSINWISVNTLHKLILDVVIKRIQTTIFCILVTVHTMYYMLQIMFQVMTVATYMHIAISETIYVYLHAWHVYHCIMHLSTYNITSNFT